jgi:hypothetical protein
MLRPRPRLTTRPSGPALALLPLALYNLLVDGPTPRESVILCTAGALLALTPWLRMTGDIGWYRDLRGWRRELDVLYVTALYVPTAVSWLTHSVAITVAACVVLTGLVMGRMEHIRRALGPPADDSTAEQVLGRALRRRRRAWVRAFRWTRAVRTLVPRKWGPRPGRR